MPMLLQEILILFYYCLLLNESHCNEQKFMFFYRFQFYLWPQLLSTKSKDEEKNKTVCIPKMKYWKCGIKCRFFLRSRKECMYVCVFVFVYRCFSLSLFPPFSQCIHLISCASTKQHTKWNGALFNYNTICVLGSLTIRTHTNEHSHTVSLSISHSLSLVLSRSSRSLPRS